MGPGFRETPLAKLFWLTPCQYADPIFKGEFPALVAKHLGDFLPSFTNNEWTLIKGSSDFFGWNHYGTNYATGKRVDSDDHRIVSFGSIEKVAEKDGQPIGNKGQGGHPYDGKYPLCRAMLTQQYRGDVGSSSSTSMTRMQNPQAYRYT